MAQFRSASQSGKLFKHMQRVAEQGATLGMSEKRVDPPEKMKIRDHSYIPDVPSTRNICRKASAVDAEGNLYPLFYHHEVLYQVC